MEIKVVIGPDEEDEIVIHSTTNDDKVLELKRVISDYLSSRQKLQLYYRGELCLVESGEILFFETQDEIVYAHTAQQMYRSKYRLYELEATLSTQFIRISKSAIVNVDYIRSIQRSLAAASLIQFRDSLKQIYVSRYYYKALKQKLEERSFNAS